MGRQVGFSLQVLGTDASIKEIERVEKRMLELGNKLIAANKKVASGSSGGSGGPIKLPKPDPADSEAVKKYHLELAEARVESTRLRKEAQLQAEQFDLIKRNIPTDSLVGMIVQSKALKAELSLLSTEELKLVENQEKLRRSEQLGNDINERKKSFGDFTSNIGRYQESIRGLLPDLERLQEAGILTQKDLVKIFTADTKARAEELKKQIHALSAEYIELRKNASKAGEAAVVLDKLKKATNELNQITAQTKSSGLSLKSFKDSIAHVGDGLTGGLITGGLFAATTATVHFAEKGIEKFVEYEKAVIRIDQIVKQTNKSAGFTTEQLKTIAEEASKLNNIDNGDFLDQITSPLLKFENIAGQVFTRAQQLIVDYSRNTGKTFAESTELIGKALNSPANAVKQLKTLGVSLNVEDAKRVKTLVEQNKILEAQVLILDKAEKTFTGQGLAQATSELGQFQAISVKFENTLENLGKALFRVGAGVLNFFEDVKTGTLGMSDANKILSKSQQDLNNTIAEGGSVIKTNFEILKQSNISTREREALVDQLKAKFPELFEGYRLESAAIKAQQGDLTALNELENEVFDNFKFKTNEKIKIRTKQQLEEKLFIAEQKATAAERAANETPEVGFVTNLLDVIGNKLDIVGLKGKVLEQTKVDLTEVATKLREEANQLKKEKETFDIRNNVRKIQANIPVELKTENTSAQVIALVDKVIEDANKALQSSTTLPGNKAGIKSILERFIGIGATDFTTQTKEQLNKTAEQANAALDKISKAAIDSSTHLTEEQKKADEEAAKLLEAQVKRIAELEALIAEKRADLITNQFDKQIADITNKANQQLEKLKLQKAEIENKKTPGAKDNEELKKIEEANTAINEALIRQKVIINTERQRAIDLFKQELQAARIELANILSELSANKTSSAIGTQEFEEQRKTNANKLEFDKQILDLDISLREKKISQEEYNKQVSELELKLATDNEAIVKQSNESLAKLYAQDFETQKEFINQKRELQRQDAINNADNQANAVIDDPNLDTFQKADKLEQIQKTLAAKLLLIDNNTANEQEALRQKTLTNIDNLGQKELQSHKAKEEAKTAATEIEEEKRQRLRELAIEKGFETAQAISNTLFEIDNARDQERADENKTRIEQEYSNRIKLAEGNAGEISRLEKEKDNKIKQIEKEAAERRKKSAINQTIIDGLLAIGKIFATIPPPGSFILAAAQAVITGLALIKIKNTPAGAKGGWTQEITGAKGGRAPKDHTGHAPAGPINTHMDEFLSPPEQTRKYSDIFQWMEEDRKSLLSGQGGTLDKRLKAKYAALSTDIVKNSTVPFKAMPRPIIVNIKSNNQVIQAEWSEEHIDKVADRLAEKTAEKTSQAIFAGTVEGSKIATLNERREQSRLQRKYN